MSVIRLILAYDGTDFHGWARQPGVRTVEGVLTETLARVLGEEPRLSVAGRTDAGVHALGQVASFRAPVGLEPARVQRAVNGMLGPEVVALEARPVRDGFDARHDAIGREYRYRIDTGTIPDPFSTRYVWHHPGALAIGPMRAAAKLLIGERDFRSFCRSPQSSGGAVRHLRRLSVSASGDRVEVRAEADAFLHQMVRSLVGTLVAVGQGKISPQAMPEILAARDRSAAGPVAPPRGLVLFRVRYERRS
jgi:tRNA pseudouridine38-40 synthase